MIDSKIVLTIISLIISIIAVNNIKPKDEIIEHMYMLPSFQTKVDTIVAPNKAAADAGYFYSVPGLFQSSLPPRFSSVDYGANILYNMPGINNQAVPLKPLDFGNMVKENYTSGVSTCNKGGANLMSRNGAKIADPSFSVGNYNNMLNNVYSNSTQNYSNLLPVNDMTSNQAPIVYDRFMFANRNSRLRSQGDKIRGDLPVVPVLSNWFRPSVQPNIDLEQGAMNVLGGVTNETANHLDKLIYLNSGNSQTPLGGVDLSGSFQNPNMSNLYTGNLSANQHDIAITAFP